MYFITLTRKMGTHGSAIARRVADELQYNLYDTEAIENTARELGFLDDVRQIDEKAPSVVQRLFSHQPEVYLDRLHAVIYELASRGNALFLGRGSHILLRDLTCALHIRVTASLETRVRSLMERGFDREVAIRALQKSDHEREAFIKFAFGRAWDAPELYDLVLNMDKLSVDLAVSTILNAARSEEIKACSVDALKSLEIMGLSSRAEAALIEAGFTYGPINSVSVTVVAPGKVQLGGMVENAAGKAMAEKVVKGLKGVVSIDNQIRLTPADRHA